MLKGVNCISRSVSCSLIYKKTKDTSEHHHIFVLFELFLKILRQAQLCPTMHHSPVLTSSRLSFSLLRISSSSSLALSRSCRRRCHSFSCSLSALLSSSLCLWGTHGNKKKIYKAHKRTEHQKIINLHKFSTNKCNSNFFHLAHKMPISQQTAIDSHSMVKNLINTSNKMLNENIKL